MKRSIVFATSHLAPLAEAARAAEAQGFFRAWTTEYTDRDALIRCAVIGGATTTLQIGTGITYSFSRHPVTLAAAALDVHEATGGRFALGLGAGTRGMRRRWFGIEDTKPVARMRESVELVRRLWAADGRVSFHGEFYDVDIDGLDFRDRWKVLPELPILGSGLNDAMMAAAGEWCDGVLLHPLAVGERSRPRVLDALGGATGRQRGDLWLSQWVITSVADDRERARALARQSLSFYLSTPSYASQFADTPWESVPAAVAARLRDIGPHWTRIAEAVPDAMLDEYAVAGTPAEARDRIVGLEEKLVEAGVGELVLQVATTDQNPDATVGSLHAAVVALAPE